ncbi:MAG: ABC transporter permease [Herpetosiphonaceae bacterium]|nr:ABC transporter permease [Herpetosiphonaceae bacterium]
MRNITTITWLTFQEARRRRTALAALLLGLAFLAFFMTGFTLISNSLNRFDNPFTRTANYNLLLMAGLYVVHFLLIMLAIFASVDTVSGEISSHTIQTIVTKPVQRWQVLLGKWLGLAIMLVLYLGLLSGGMFLGVYLLTGYLPPNPVEGLLLLMLEALMLLSVSLLCGTRFSTLTNGLVLLMLYGVAFIGSWIEQIGTLFQSDAATTLGIVTSFILPVEAVWRRAAYLMETPLARNLPSPFSMGSVPSSAMVIYAVIYVVVAWLLAARAFAKRDL